MSAMTTEGQSRRAGYGAIGDTLLEAAGAVLARGARLTNRALRVETGWTRSQVASRVQRLKEGQRWPYRLVPDFPPRPWNRFEARKAETRARWAEAEARVLDAAAGVADGEGRTALADLVEASGLDYDRVWQAVKRLRDRREWPYLSSQHKPPKALDHEEMRDVEGRLAEVDAEIMAGLSDGRHEIDDPLKYAGVAPCSGQRHVPPRRSLRWVCRQYYDEWRAIRCGTPTRMLESGYPLQESPR